MYSKKRLQWKDRFLRVAESSIESETEGAILAPFLLQNEPNKLLTDWTGEQYTKIFSALYTGAHLMFPEEASEIIWQFLRPVHQPLSLEGEEDNCINYPPSAPLLQYIPQNPFNEPDLVPEGYISSPFHYNQDFAYPELLGYQATDVLVQLDAIPIFGDWGDVLGLQFPTIKLTVTGQGQIELDLLSVQLGGLAIVKVGSPPNIIDLIDGIVETGVVVVDLQQDFTSIPFESDMVISEEIDIDALEPTDVYIVFVPKLDASTDFFGFGGGIRQIGLCGLEEIGTMFVEDIRFNTDEYQLEKRINGIWSLVAGYDEWMDYIYDIEGTAVSAESKADAAAIQIMNLESFDITVTNDLNSHNDRITVLEGEMDDVKALQATHDTSIANLASRMDTAEDDIDALEAALAALESGLASQAVWSQEFDFMASDGGWSGGNPYSSGNGWLISSASPSISKVGANVADSRITFVVLQLRRLVGVSFVSLTFTLGGENAQECSLSPVASGSTTEWMQINRISNNYTQEITFAGVSGLNTFYIEKVTYWGRGDNPF